MMELIKLILKMVFPRHVASGLINKLRRMQVSNSTDEDYYRKMEYSLKWDGTI